jgi:hypothetical protein
VDGAEVSAEALADVAELWPEAMAGEADGGADVVLAVRASGPVPFLELVPTTTAVAIAITATTLPPATQTVRMTPSHIPS